MSTEMVKYHNVLNSLSFKEFEQRDFDLFMAICARMRDLDETEVSFDYRYLMDLIGWDVSKSVRAFHDDLRRMNEKLVHISGSIDLSSTKSVTLVLFPTFERDLVKRTLTVQANTKYKYILNQLTANFTTFELREYVGLCGRYAKQLYQQIRQRYRMRGHFWQPDLAELRTVLSIPESYTAKRIYTLIIEPAVDTLRSCKGLEELSVEVIRESRRGRPVKGYRFTWTEEKQIPGQLDLEFGEDDSGKGSKRKSAGRPANFHQRKCGFDDEYTDT